MAAENGKIVTHCLVLPFGLQGHVNPMLQFSNRLRSNGINRITLVLPASFLKSVPVLPVEFPVETITDGVEEAGAASRNGATPDECLKIGWGLAGESLRQLLVRLRSTGSAAECLIYDAFFPWALDVAKEQSLTTAVFFTQSNAVNSIYYHAYKGELKLPVSGPEIRIPGGLPVFSPADMPSFIREYESDRIRAQIMMNQFMNIETTDWVLVNTFHELEREVCDWMAKIMPARPIGPTIPSMYTDKRLPEDGAYALSAFTPITDPCTNWLDKHDVRSVIYVSFGSFAQPSAEQIGEVARALTTCGWSFLWVVRASEEAKLPENFRQETTPEKGLVVTWCNQLDVLGHAAVGCFVTHCGWNSTVEALNAGVPMVALPQWSDQFTNAKMVADVWKLGVRGKEDEEGIVREGEIVRCLQSAMEDETMRTSAEKWRELAKEAVGEGGSSDKNIQDFVHTLKFINTGV